MKTDFERLLARFRTAFDRKRFGQPAALEAEPAVLPAGLQEEITDICPWLGHREREWVAAAAGVAAQRLPAIPPALAPRLDTALRGRWSAHQRTDRYHDRWPEAAMIDRLPESPADRNAGLVVMACHSNGFVRQRAVAELSEVATPAALAILALRLGDWATRVRERAEATWARLLPGLPLEIAIEALPLLVRILAHERVAADRAWRPLAARLETPEGHEALRDALTGKDEPGSRAAWTAAMKIGRRPAGWLERALASRAVWVRTKALTLLIDGLQSGALEPACGERELRRLACDPFPPIRRRALEAVASFFPELLEPLARQGLLDPTAGIRQRCQEILVVELDLDPLPIYLACLDREAPPKDRAAALFGLAETGGPGERKVSARYLGSPSPRVRAAATALLGRTIDGENLGLLFRLLHDASPAVIAQAELALRRSSWPEQSLLASFEAGNERASVLALLRLSAKVAMDVRLSLLIRALGHPEKDVRKAASAWLGALTARGWFFGTIPASRKAELRHDLEAAAGRLARNVELDLRSLLR